LSHNANKFHVKHQHHESLRQLEKKKTKDAPTKNSMHWGWRESMTSTISYPAGTKR